MGRMETPDTRVLDHPGRHAAGALNGGIEYHLAGLKCPVRRWLDVGVANTTAAPGRVSGVRLG